MQAQNKWLLSYLEHHEAMTPLVAWVELGIYRLWARIFDLKKIGVRITSSRVKVKSQFGENCLVAECRIESVK